MTRYGAIEGNLKVILSTSSIFTNCLQVTQVVINKKKLLK